MSTLVEIESAVTSLPASQQQLLLVWLQSVVGTSQAEARQPQAGREAWLRKLAVRRERGRTGKTGTPLQQIMNDLRGE